MSIARSKWLVLFALVALAATLAACAAPAPQVVEKVVTQVVREEVQVIQTQVVEVAKEVEKIVEVVVTPTPAPSMASDTFVFGAQGEPVCLDAPVITDGISGRVINQIFEGLVKFDKDTTNVVPGLAESWTTSDDGLEWTFKLREGVKFHDGTDFNADAVVANFDYWKNTANPNHVAQTEAGRAFEYFEAQFGGFDDASIISSVEAVDPTTVKITLKQPQGPFLNNLAMFVFVFSSPTALAANGVDSCANPVGTGPYKFVEWLPNEQVTLVAFEDYWDTANAAKTPNVIIRNIPNNSARLLALSAGEIQGMEGLEPRDVAAVQDNPAFKLILRPTNTTGYVAFNYNVEEFKDPQVREAFAMAINKQAIVDAFYGGTGIVANQFQPPSLWGYNPDIVDRTFDAEAAKQLLVDAGFPDGIGEVTFNGEKVPLEFWYMPVSRPYYPNPKDIATAIAADWASGINVSPQTVMGDYLLAADGEPPLYSWLDRR
jgi:peptide/nickel transport system substrate-binding protein